MQIKEFVENVISDLIKAVDGVSASASREVYLTGNESNRAVEFDIAVSVEEGSSVGGKAGIKVLQFVEGGGDIRKESKNSTVSRIKFGVNISHLTKNEESEQDTAVRRLNNQSSDECI